MNSSLALRYWHRVALALLGASFAAGASAQRVMGVGDVPDPKDCGTTASLPCVVDVKPVIDEDTETCRIEAPKVPFVLRGQTIRWRLDPSVPDVEFLRKRGIRIDRNVYQRTPTKMRYFECSVDPNSSREYTCTRNDRSAQEQERRAFSYTIFIRHGTGADRQICYVDPLIVSRD